MVPLCTGETVTLPPVTSKSKAAGTALLVESSIKQHSSADRAGIYLRVCHKPGREGICACFCWAGGGEAGRKASRTSKMHMMLSVNNTQAELGQKASHPPSDYFLLTEQGFSLSCVELGTFNCHLISHPFFCMCVHIYACAPYRIACACGEPDC